MKKLFAVPLLVASLVPTTFLAAMTLIGSLVVAAAQSPPAGTSADTAADRMALSPGKQTAPRLAPTTSAEVRLLITKFQTLTELLGLAGGGTFTRVFQTTLGCPGGTPACELGIEARVQIGHSTTSPSAYCVSAKVDGNLLGCFWAGYIPTDHYETRVSLQHFRVVPGTHNVELWVYVAGAGRAFLGSAEAIYRVYFE